MPPGAATAAGRAGNPKPVLARVEDDRACFLRAQEPLGYRRFVEAFEKRRAAAAEAAAAGRRQQGGRAGAGGCVGGAASPLRGQASASRTASGGSSL